MERGGTGVDLARARIEAKKLFDSGWIGRGAHGTGAALSGRMKNTQRTRLVENHLPLVRHLAARMIHRVRPYVEKDDLIAIGTEALLRAAERFDPSRGVSFGTFAYLRVRGAMCESIGAVGPLSRGMMRRRRGRPERRVLPAVLQFDETEPPRTGAALRDLCEALTSAIDASRLTPRLGVALGALDDRDRQLILRHYFAGDTLDEIGRDMGHSRSWASRIHTRALARLRAALEPAGRAAAIPSVSCASL
jgi:RNA polymerase sigma factor FliA